jgi:bacteriorhodopsin
MFPLILAQLGIGFDVGRWAIIAVVVAAIIGVVYVGLQQAGIAIPAFVVRVFWIVVAAVICVVAIKFLLGIM